MYDEYSNAIMSILNLYGLRNEYQLLSESRISLPTHLQSQREDIFKEVYILYT